jgi:hypothetical protein
MLNTLEKSILATLALYESLGSVPTSFEVWQRLVNPEKVGLEGRLEKVPSLGKIKELLDSGKIGGVAMGFQDGFYCLAGSEYLAAKRSASIKISQHKISLAKRRLKKILSFCPFILGVALEGSVAEGRARKSSDIDLLVICRSGRIWTARAFFDRTLTLLGWRRQGKELAQDRFCLNHYLTPLDLKIQPGLYHAFLHSHLMPLGEVKSGVFNKFLKSNSWIGEFLPNMRVSPLAPAIMEVGPPYFGKGLEWFWGGLAGEPLEAVARVIQKRIIARNPLTAQKGGRIRADDKQLEFHPILIENELLKKIRSRLKALGIDK